jgi:hypothetical protein
MGAERNSLIKGLRWPARIPSQRWDFTDHGSPITMVIKGAGH